MTYLKKLLFALSFLMVSGLALVLTGSDTAAQEEADLPPAFRMESPERVSPEAADAYFDALRSQQPATKKPPKSTSGIAAANGTGIAAAQLTVPDIG